MIASVPISLSVYIVLQRISSRFYRKYRTSTRRENCMVLTRVSIISIGKNTIKSGQCYFLGLRIVSVVKHIIPDIPFRIPSPTLLEVEVVQVKLLFP